MCAERTVPVQFSLLKISSVQRTRMKKETKIIAFIVFQRSGFKVNKKKKKELEMKCDSLTFTASNFFRAPKTPLRINQQRTRSENYSHKPHNSAITPRFAVRRYKQNPGWPCRGWRRTWGWHRQSDSSRAIC